MKYFNNLIMSQNIKDKIKLFSSKPKTEERKNNDNDVKINKFSGDKKSFLNILSSNALKYHNINKTNSSNIKEDLIPKLLSNSEIISKENPNMIIYKYPNDKLPKNISNNCKVLLFFGDKQNMFVNTFINFYRDISFEDNFRYKIESEIFNDFKIYEIKGRNIKYNIKIICFPNFIQNKNDFVKSETIKKLNDLFKSEILNRINYIFLALDETKCLDNKEITFFYLFANLFNKENIKKRIMVLFASNKSNEKPEDNIKIINNLFNYKKDHLLFGENYDSYFSSLFEPEFYYINNNILYEKNNGNEEMKKLYEKMKIIENKINSSKSEKIDKEKVDFINKILTYEDNHTLAIFKELEKCDRHKTIIYLYFLLNCDINKDISKIIIKLYNMINETQKLPTTKINFFKDEYLKRYLSIYSKLQLPDLGEINGEKCDLNDNDLKSLQKLFTSKLKKLYFQNNQISDITILKDAFSNIQDLVLCNNNISNINILSINKCNNLVTLNLSHNKITDISAFSNGDSSNFQNLKSLDLSYNNIKKLNKINIKTIETLNLLNNEISEVINDFMDYCCLNSTHVSIVNGNNELAFHYSYGTDIKFNYLLKEKDKKDFLSICSFKGIKYIVFKDFTNIDFLINESLNMLHELYLGNSLVDDISIFNKIKFINIKKINLGNNLIVKGFHSLYAFKSIKATSVNIFYNENYNYSCNIQFDKPYMEINFLFKEIDFLKENLLKEAYNINISQPIFDNNQNYFSFEAIKNSFPIFKKLMTHELNIDYKPNENKYEFSAKFNHSIRLKFKFNDMHYLKDDIFNDIKSLMISNSIINDNIDLSREKFPKLYYIQLDNNKIESIRIFDYIEEINRINKKIIDYNNNVINIIKKPLIILKSNSNVCNNNLIGLLIGEKFEMNQIDTKNNEIQLNYIKPINFVVLINQDKLNEIKSFNICKTIDLVNIDLSQNDFNFLNNATLFYLEYIYLNGNKLTNLNFLDKISSKCLRKISIQNNFIDSGIEYITSNKFICNSINVKIKDDNKNNILISFSFYYNNQYRIYLDQLYDVNKNLDILKNINFDFIYELNLSNLNIKNIEFLSNRTLTSLKLLYLDSNKIEDLSIFTNEKIYFRLYKLSIKNNSIRKGLHVLNNDLFKQCIYIELNVTKCESEYKICTNYKCPHYDIEFYVNSPNDIVNILDFKNSFIKLNENAKDNVEMKLIENTIKSSESIDNRKQIFEIILFLINLSNEGYYNNINIIYDNKSNEFGKNNNIYINDNNKDLIEKSFKILLDKLNIFYVKHTFPYLNLYNISSKHENIIVNLPFKNSTNLSLFDCDFDLGILQRTKLQKIKNIDLSHSKISSIKGLSGDVPFENLEILNLSNNKSIEDLGELKEAKFRNLKELYLSNDNLGDLNAINLGEYKFYSLQILDLSHNHIEYLSPLKFYRNLKILDLQYNSINDEKELDYIAYLNGICSIKLLYNNVSGRDLGIFAMIK